MRKSSSYIEREFNSIAFFAVGSASEAGASAYQLSFAGRELNRYGKKTNISSEIVEIIPEGNSGYSFSMMQSHFLNK